MNQRPTRKLLLAVLVLTAFPLAASAQPIIVENDIVFFDFPDEAGNLDGGVVELQIEREAAGAPPRLAMTASASSGMSANRVDIVIVGDGYTDRQLRIYEQHAAEAMNTFFETEPFRSYEHHFNVHRIDVVSNESGVDNDPTDGIDRDTALDMRFWCNNIERLLCVSVSKARSYARNAPDDDLILAIANSSKYGGAGYSSSDLATVAGGNHWSADVAIHEFGHSLGNLADEYTYGGPTVYTGVEPIDANVSIFEESRMLSRNVKWAAWIGDSDPRFNGLVSTFEGAMYSEQGIYRPTADSKMRSLGDPFNLPSIEALILEIYRFVRPIDDSTPTFLPLDGTEDVFVALVQPASHNLDVQWYLDDVPLDNVNEGTLSLAELGLATGVYSLSVEVVDNTWFVRDETARAQWMSDARAWTLDVNRSDGDLNCDGVINFFDIDAFVTALLDSAAYEARHPFCDRLLADLNRDGQVDFFDIDPFVGLILN